MIALALMAAQVVAPVAAPEDDIVVMARRMSRIRFSYHVKKGQLLRCEVTRSSDSAAIDAMVCEASRQCAVENPMLGDHQLVPCVEDRVRSLATAYRAGRAATPPEGR